MRKLLSILVIFLLVFTYSMPAYAEDLSSTTNSESEQAEDSGTEENGEEKLVEDTGDEEGSNNEETLKSEEKDEEDSNQKNQNSPEEDKNNSNDDGSNQDASSNVKEEPVDEDNDGSKDKEVNIPDEVTPLGVNTSDNIIEEPVIPELPESNIDVSPIFEGWVDNGDGTYKAYFGYENKSTDAYGNEMDVTLTRGTSENKVTGPADINDFPENFKYPNEISGRPGRSNWFPDAPVVIDDWDGNNIVWTLDGKTATASLNEGLEKIYYEVTFNSNGGSSVPSQNVLEGDTVDKPTNPTRSGYIFTGWTIEGVLYNFNSPVEFDLTLIANWEIIPADDDGGEDDTGDTGGGGAPEDDATIEAVTDNLSTVENLAVSVDTSTLMANDIDADDFVSVQNPVNGSVSLSGTTVTFTPNTDFAGTGYFYYTIEDFGDQDNGIVVVDVEALTEIATEETPLGGGNPDELLVIEPETTPLGTIDYSMPYIIGYPNDTFRPERQVTRGEMAAIFARILGLDLSNPGEALYEDVNSDDWYYEYVQGVSRLGLFGGYEDNMFKPNRPVTHAEIASAFSAYWDLRGLELDSEGDFYTDISGHWAEEMINHLYNAGISVTYPDATFRPDTFTSRTELVVMVNRALNREEEMREEQSFVDVSPSFWGYGEIEAATSMEEESVKLEQ